MELNPAEPELTAVCLLSLSLVLFMAGRFIGTALMQRVSATRLLLVFATIDIVLIVIAAFAPGIVAVAALTLPDRKSVVSGKSVSVSVDIGGRQIIKKKEKNIIVYHRTTTQQYTNKK